jgi:hypothetical protein
MRLANIARGPGTGVPALAVLSSPFAENIGDIPVVMKASKKMKRPASVAAAAAPGGRVSTRTLVVAAGAAVALAVALFGFQAGWFTSSEDDEVAWSVSTHAPRNPASQKIVSASGGVVQASWDPLPAGTPVEGVGPAVAPEAPSQIAVPLLEGRGSAGVRVPRKRPSGANYTAYAVELRSGTQRVWGTYLPIRGAREDFAVLALAFDAAAMRAGNVDTSAMTLLVSGVALEDPTRDKHDTIGEVRLSLK